MPATTRSRRAIGIVRVSQTKGREGESFHSPGTQRDRIGDTCDRNGWRLLEVHEELDVSGGKSLEARPALRAAVEAIEARQADVLAVAYLDRLTRDPRVRDEVVDRVEAAGGEVWTVDMGRQTNGTAAEQLTGTMASAVHRYVRRVAAERSREAQVRAVSRGVLPFPNVPPGYRRGHDGRLEPDPKTAPIVAEAFRMRAEGATLNAVRDFLGSQGIKRSFHGVCSLLASRIVLGEIRFGDLSNPDAHEPIVSRDVWQAVQQTRVSRGRRAKSERLLARLGVLRCGICGARMVVGTANQTKYYIYRCPPNNDCPRHMTISAEIVEEIVTNAVREALGDVEGRASAENNARETELALEKAQSELDAAIRVLADFADEPAALERLSGLRTARDEARERLAQLGGVGVTITVGAGDWDRLTLEERRSLIRATCERVTVHPGRGPERITVRLFGE